MFCLALLCVHFSFVIISMEKRELVSLLCLSSWCLMIVVRLFLTMSQVCLQFVIVIFPDHTHLLFSFYETLANGAKPDCFCNAVLSVIYSFAIISLRKRVLVANFKCVAVRRAVSILCAVGLYVVCDCGISGHTHFCFAFVN